MSRKHTFSEDKCLDCSISQLLVVEAGDARIVDAKFGPIHHIHKNGQMALVDWFSFGNEEINGAFVSSIVYRKPKATDEGSGTNHRANTEVVES